MDVLIIVDSDWNDMTVELENKEGWHADDSVVTAQPLSIVAQCWEISCGYGALSFFFFFLGGGGSEGLLVVAGPPRPRH